jgi:hypothetical protein
MTKPIGKERKRVVSPATMRKIADGKLPPAKIKPNPPSLKLRRASRNTIATRPHKHVERTKAEMYEDLRKAVENTK